MAIVTREFPVIDKDGKATGESQLFQVDADGDVWISSSYDETDRVLVHAGTLDLFYERQAEMNALAVEG